MILLKPSIELKSGILDYKKEWFDQGYTNVNGSSGLAYFADFDKWLNYIASMEKDKTGEGALVDTYFSVRESDGKIIGSCKLRHSLTDSPEKYGGHISYGIRPSERKKGYGREQLQLVLEKAQGRGMNRVMVTCDKRNAASAHTIISCGGVFTKEVEEEDMIRQVYWIDM